MTQWLKDRLVLLKAARPRPQLLLVFGALQAARLLLGLAHPRPDAFLLSGIVAATPWYGWAIGWLALFWAGSIEYSVERKRSFDRTSLNFFKAFLDYLLKEGRLLFRRSGEPDFYARIGDWQRRVIEGIAIGQGHRESADYFEKMETRCPLAEAYRESRDSGSNEPLCRALEENLVELESIRRRLGETGAGEKGEPKPPSRGEMDGTPDPPRLPPQ